MSNQVYGYIRVSTAEQVESGLGLDAQAEKIARYATLMEIEVNEVFTDDGVSASIPLRERPMGGEMWRRMADGHDDSVIVVRLDRAFRSTLDCLSTVDEWRRRGSALHIVDLSGTAVSTQTATGKLILTSLAAIAEFERDTIRDRTRDAMAAAKRNGIKIGRPPYGWEVARDAEGVATWVEVPEEQTAIQIMMDMRLSGATYRVIAERANDIGLPHGGEKWHASRIQRILSGLL